MVKLPKARLVFVVTTGRSGSLYFANLINANATNATAEHEPFVVSADDSAKWYYDDDQEQLQAQVQKKLARLRIGEQLARLPRSEMITHLLTKSPIAPKLAPRVPRVPVKDVYVEVNNSFLKSYGEELLRVVPDVDIVHVTRDPFEMARSAVNRGSHPDPLRPYYLWPSRARNTLRLDEDVTRSLTPFQLGLWYWLEMEARFASILERHPLIEPIHLDLADLNESTKVEALFHALGIRSRELTFDVDTHQGRRSNVESPADVQQATELLRLLPTGSLSGINNTYGLREFL